MMILEKIISEGLAQRSYILRDGYEAIVIDLQKHLDEIDKDKPVVTFCDGGRRAIIAASILKRNGFKQVEDSLGSMEACKSIGCSIQKG